VAEFALGGKFHSSASGCSNGDSFKLDGTWRVDDACRLHIVYSDGTSPTDPTVPVFLSKSRIAMSGGLQLRREGR
jgi:hypothetical protein